MSLNFLKLIRRYAENEMYAFFIGFFCALIGISTAFLLFPENVGMVSVFFTSLALLPFWDKIIKACSIRKGAHEKIISRQGVQMTEIRMKSLKRKINLAEIIFEHLPVFKAYIFSFIGVFFVYTILQMLLPVFDIHSIFADQLSLLKVNPAVMNSGSMFLAILSNNITVLFICFLIALVFRSGVFIIAWNASVWGVVFGAVMSESGVLLQANSFLLFGLVIIGIAPHMIMEAFSYICGAISGSLLFESIYKKMKPEMFNLYVNDALLILVFGLVILVISAAIEIYFAFPIVQSVLGLT